MNEDLQMQIAIFDAAARLFATGRYDMYIATKTAMRMWNNLAAELETVNEQDARTSES